MFANLLVFASLAFFVHASPPAVYQAIEIPFNHFCPQKVSSGISSQSLCSAICHSAFGETSVSLHDKVQEECSCGTIYCHEKSNTTKNDIVLVHSASGKSELACHRVLYC